MKKLHRNFVHNSISWKIVKYIFLLKQFHGFKINTKLWGKFVWRSFYQASYQHFLQTLKSEAKRLTATKKIINKHLCNFLQVWISKLLFLYSSTQFSCTCTIHRYKFYYGKSIYMQITSIDILTYDGWSLLHLPNPRTVKNLFSFFQFLFSRGVGLGSLKTVKCFR